MDSPPLVIAPQAAEAAATGGWTIEPDEVVNGFSGWEVDQNKPFFVLVQPPDGEVFEQVKHKVGRFSLIGKVRRTAKDQLVFQAGKKKELLKFYPERIISKYWHEAQAPSHNIAGRAVTVNDEDPQFALDVEYEYYALQFKFLPPATSLANGKKFIVPFDTIGK